MNVKQAKEAIKTGTKLHGLLLDKFAHRCDGLQRKDREQPKDSRTSAYDRYDDGVQDAFEAFVLTFEEVSIDELQEIFSPEST